MVVGLSGAVLVKEGMVTATAVAAHKDEIEALSNLVTIAAIVVGGMLSYLRFFKGRLFKPKLDLHPSTGSVDLGSEVLHWIDVELQNRGSVPIWNYTIEIVAVLHGPSDERVRVLNTLSGTDPLDEHLIDVGETAVEHGLLRVPRSFSAVTFEIVLKDHDGTRWQRFITSANRPA